MTERDEPESALELSPYSGSEIQFKVGRADEPILVLDAEGMTYKGERIEDAGEAHKAFMAAMRAYYGGDELAT